MGAKEYLREYTHSSLTDVSSELINKLETMNHSTIEDVKEKTDPLINLIQRESDGNEMQLRAVLITVVQRLAELEKLKI